MYDGVGTATFTVCESNLPKMPNCAGYMFLKLEKKNGNFT